MEKQNMSLCIYWEPILYENYESFSDYYNYCILNKCETNYIICETCKQYKGATHESK